MSYEVLARKWRPAHFAQMVGQEAVVRALQHALEQNRLHHAYLFTGTRGVGKTTVARILARCLNCEKGVGPKPCDACTSCEEIRSGRFPDLIEVDAASRTKVEDTRELLENVQYTPVRGRFKIYLIDEVHMLSGHSFNALLKTLEEPPEHVKFLLATTDPQKLPATVLSRCLQFHLRQVPAAEIASYLQTMLKGEEISAAPAALQQLAEAAQGSVRDAISLTDQAIAHGGGRLEEREVREMLGTVDRGRVVRLLETLADEDGPALFQEVGQLAELCPDYEGVLKELLSALHRMAVFQAVPELSRERAEDAQGEELQALAKRITPERLQLFYQAGVVGRRDFYLAPDPRSSLEMTLLRMLSFLPAARAAPLDERQSQQAPAAQPQSAAAQQTGTPASDTVQPAVQSDDAHTAAETSPPTAAPEQGAAAQQTVTPAGDTAQPAAPAGDAVQTAAQSGDTHTAAAASPPAAAPELAGNGAAQQNNAPDAGTSQQPAQAPVTAPVQKQGAAAQQTATPAGDATHTAAQREAQQGEGRPADTTAAASPPAAAPGNAGNGATQRNNAPDAAAPQQPVQAPPAAPEQEQGAAAQQTVTPAGDAVPPAVQSNETHAAAAASPPTAGQEQGVAAQQTKTPASNAAQPAAQPDAAHTTAEASPPAAAAAPENTGNGATQQKNAPDAAAPQQPVQAPPAVPGQEQGAAAQQTKAPASNAAQPAAQTDSAHTAVAASTPAAAPENTGNGAAQQNNAPDAAAQPQPAQASATAPENTGNGAVPQTEAPQTAEQQEAEQRFLQDPGVRRLRRHLPVELEPGSLRVYGD